MFRYRTFRWGVAFSGSKVFPVEWDSRPLETQFRGSKPSDRRLESTPFRPAFKTCEPFGPGGSGVASSPWLDAFVAC